MSGDSLYDLLAMARKDLPDVPDEVWKRFETLAKYNFGQRRIYIPAHRKQSHLNFILSNQDMSAKRLSEILGVSERRIYQLKNYLD